MKKKKEPSIMILSNLWQQRDYDRSVFYIQKKKKKKMAVKANICEIIHAASITYFDHSS